MRLGAAEDIAQEGEWADGALGPTHGRCERFLATTRQMSQARVWSTDQCFFTL